jgi:hypothetical protein
VIIGRTTTHVKHAPRLRGKFESTALRPSRSEIGDLELGAQWPIDSTKSHSFLIVQEIKVGCSRSVRTTPFLPRRNCADSALKASDEALVVARDRSPN